MNVVNCCSRKKFFFNIPLLAITICYASIVYCKNNKIVNLENTILSNANKHSDEFYAAFDEIDTLSIGEAIILLVRLSDYYLGAAGGEIYLEKTTKIGERILPYLVQKRNMPIICKKEYNNLCYKNIKKRNVRIRIAIEAIKKGIIFYGVFPEKLDREAKGYLEIIEIFLEDYKKKKENFPKDLHELREYAWREYGYKLKVFNPWGQPYQYSLQGNDKYVLEIGDDNQYGWPIDEKETSHINPIKKNDN